MSVRLAKNVHKTHEYYNSKNNLEKPFYIEVVRVSYICQRY